MTVESNFAIAITTHSDWLQNLAPVGYPLDALSSRAWSKSHVIARNSDWFIALFAPDVIGRSKHFGICFSTVI